MLSKYLVEEQKDFDAHNVADCTTHVRRWLPSNLKDDYWEICKRSVIMRDTLDDAVAYVECWQNEIEDLLYN